MTAEEFQLKGQAGRLDKILTDLMPGESRSTIQKIIKDGLVKVDGHHQKANFKLKGDECLLVERRSFIVKEDTLPEAEAMDLNIVYEDDDILVINKPAGLVVHPSKGHLQGTLVNGLLHYLNGNLSCGSDLYRPGIVHRIDKDTSGLLVVAKHNAAHQALADQLVNHDMRRSYMALVHGHVKAPQGTIEAPLQRDPANRLRWTVAKDGKYALTRFQVLESYENATLLDLELETGRTHQIRVHLEFIGHPLVGDPVYRKGLDHVKGSLVHDMSGQLLHAYALKLQHPRTGEWLEFKAPLPGHFEQVLSQLA
ncbi:RluA family pseudouridine synthase [uncultured Abiotrophia sp.]|jgi:pseudouridine synthase, rluA family|uniref:RluA family pseudouridine synthase n=1 Tax=uncultured Abiotrophia sp. TaxID=316094 RepID=UPI0028E35EF4|nr:RluA family pseudouridine synthase [uncultured Abiotrophia sp.]